MKKILSLFSLLMLCFLSFPGFSQVRFGVQAGINSSRFAHVLEDDNQEEARDITQFRLGYSGGLAVEVKLTEAFSLQSGITWTNKGVRFGDKGENSNGPYDFTNSLSLNYLELPVHVAYSRCNFQVHAGPYLGLGMLGGIRHRSKGLSGNPEVVKGKIKFKNTVSIADYKDVKDGEFLDFRRRLDYGLNVGVGYRLGPTLLSTTYSWGLANISPKYISDNTVTFSNGYKEYNRVISLSAAYFFKG